ncbi:uncharacterized protein N0V89_012272 [Didymosphaeria variabile]|uniref:DUF6924 domain-containing protein n=1 Tax=Didymosphaeria variabile TaxID=1932322 RepID=A0A9W8XAR2_9PLEO|nr:uncharacterized protein N0V89_012272 [Didymosphaeria variabile]KAJ4344529.1 hypothetical protein N0V89_012272 [Didymosphaeria variabile]
MPGIIIVTAQDADAALINRLLLYVRDWEFSGGDIDDADRFTVLSTQQELLKVREDGNEGITRPPIQEFSENEWEGLTVEEVEKIMIDNDTEKNGCTSLFLLLDDEGAEKKTILVVNRAGNDPEDDAKFDYVDEFHKVRVPWECVYSMWCNLDIANMGFDEFCKEEDLLDSTKKGDPRRWWTYNNFMGEEHYKPFKGKAEEAIKELGKLDLA